ncbi:16S rRNA (uracil(1498)-N(3))-methyltransferase [Faecalicatena sp. Marseille-Q4148]|nr:16S rRNA (uracil(1498)-N(3))-methyltransferase [Faecalicatena sp. Marseille-Q4148]
MHQFFVTPAQVEEDKIYIHGSDVNHIKNVLRMQEGEEIRISDGNNCKYLCAIQKISPEEITAVILEEEAADNELPSRIYLFQGLPKADKMELIIQKAVELGVYEIIPVEMKRSVVRLDAKKAAKKVERWNEISRSAAKQSGRNLVPKVERVMTFAEALQKANDLDIVLLPYELSEGMSYTRNCIEQIRPGQSIGIFIGPEGGFDQAEVLVASEKKAKPVTLGKRILRTETAGLTMLSILMYHLEEKNPENNIMEE